MSERSARIFWKVLVVVVSGTGILGMFSARRDGVRAGRAEMKRWQDDWYAAHPVVKEVPVTDQATVDLAYSAGVNYVIDTLCKDMHLKCAFKPQPSKARKPRSKAAASPDGFELEGRGPCAVTEEGVTRPCTIKELAQPEVKPAQLEQMPSLGEARKFDGQQYIWNGREWMAILKGGGVTDVICWGDQLVNDKHPEYEICVPPLYPEDYLQKLLSNEKKLYDDGWYKPMLIGKSDLPDTELCAWSDESACKRIANIPKPKKSSCEGIFLEGYGDQIHWAKF